MLSHKDKGITKLLQDLHLKKRRDFAWVGIANLGRVVINAIKVMVVRTMDISIIIVNGKFTPKNSTSEFLFLTMLTIFFFSLLQASERTFKSRHQTGETTK